MSLEHKNTYNSEICNKNMTFQDCELAIIRHAADENEKLQGEEVIRSEDIKDIIKILEEFIIRKKVICYGGIAINNILPKNVQFYNKNSDIPDYDFFSVNALEDAKELTDLYYSKGYTEVEAKSGMHVGTYKVFVNYFQIADITFIEPELFKMLEKDAIVVAGIYYTPPDFLRMSIYLEFSRPSGDVSRWEKIYKRLKLLNKYYPFANNLHCNRNNSIEDCKPKDKNCKKIDDSIFYLTRDSLIQQGVVFFGSYATSLYTKYDKNSYHNNAPPKIVWKNSEMDVLSEDPPITSLIIKELLLKNGYKNITEIVHEPFGEIIPKNIEILVDNVSIVKIFWTIACHNYNTITIGQKEINIATIDTILSFYLAILYTNDEPSFKERIMCMAKFLFDIQAQNKLEQKGLLKRFDMKCIGKQPTIEEIRSEKSRIFNELKNKKNSKEYEMWFLRYIPKEKSTNKQLGVYNEKPGEPFLKEDSIEEETPQEKKPRKKQRKTQKKKNTKKYSQKIYKKNKRKNKDYLY